MKKQNGFGNRQFIMTTAGIAAAMLLHPMTVMAEEVDNTGNDVIETDAQEQEAPVQESVAEAVQAVQEHAAEMTKEEPSANEQTDTSSNTETSDRADTAVSGTVDAPTETKNGSITEVVNAAAELAARADEKTGDAIREAASELEKNVADAQKHIENAEDVLDDAKDIAEEHAEQLKDAGDAVTLAQEASDSAQNALEQGAEEIKANTDAMNQAYDAADADAARAAYDAAVAARDMAQNTVDAAKEAYDAAMAKYDAAIAEAQGLEDEFRDTIDAARAEADAALASLTAAQQNAETIRVAAEEAYQKYEEMAKDGNLEKANDILKLEQEISEEDTANPEKLNDLLRKVISDYYFPIEKPQEGETIVVTACEPVEVAQEGVDTNNLFKVTYTVNKDGESREITSFVNYSLKPEKDQMEIHDQKLESVTKEMVEKPGDDVYLVDGVAYSREQLLSDPTFIQQEDGTFKKFVQTETTETVYAGDGTTTNADGSTTTTRTIDGTQQTRYYEDEEGNTVEEVSAEVETKTVTRETIQGNMGQQLVNVHRYQTLKVPDPDNVGFNKYVWDNATRDAERSAYWKNTAYPAITRDASAKIIADLKEKGGTIEGNYSFTALPMYVSYGTLLQQNITLQARTGLMDVDKLLTTEEYQNLMLPLEQKYAAAASQEEKDAAKKEAEGVLAAVYRTRWGNVLAKNLSETNKKYQSNLVRGIIFYDGEHGKEDDQRAHAYEEGYSIAAVDSQTSLVYEDGKFKTSGIVDQSYVDEYGIIRPGSSTNNYFRPIIDIDLYSGSNDMTVSRSNVKNEWDRIKGDLTNELKTALVKTMAEVTGVKDENYWQGIIYGAAQSSGMMYDYLHDRYDYTAVYNRAQTAVTRQVLRKTIGALADVFASTPSKTFDTVENPKYRDWVTMQESIERYLSLTESAETTVERIENAKIDVELLIQELDHLKLGAPDSMVAMVDGTLALEEARIPFVTIPDEPDVAPPAETPNEPTVPMIVDNPQVPVQEAPIVQIAEAPVEDDAAIVLGAERDMDAEEGPDEKVTIPEVGIVLGANRNATTGDNMQVMLYGLGLAGGLSALAAWIMTEKKRRFKK